MIYILMENKNMYRGLKEHLLSSSHLSLRYRLASSIEQLLEMLTGMPGQLGNVAGRDEVFRFGHGDRVILGEGDEFALGDALAGRTEDAAAHIDGLGGRIDGLLGAGLGTCSDHICRCVGIDPWPSPVARTPSAFSAQK